MPNDTSEARQQLLRQLLQSIIADRHQHGESLADVGRVIAQLIAPNHRPLSRQYVYLLANGRTDITAEIGRAIETLAAMQDGVAAIQAQARPVTVPLLTTHDLPPYTIITSKPRPCALAGCRIVFVGPPQQHYCGPDCRAEAARRRRYAAKARPEPAAGRRPEPVEGSPKARKS
jgi:hypothetical protein